jgi:long-chain acyl-CoA synthetase
MVDSFNLFDGSHVAPGPIEDAVTRLPWVKQVLLLGDQRPYLTGLVVPQEALRGDAATRAPAPGREQHRREREHARWRRGSGPSFVR